MVQPKMLPDSIMGSVGFNVGLDQKLVEARAEADSLAVKGS